MIVSFIVQIYLSKYNTNVFNIIDYFNIIDEPSRNIIDDLL